MHFYVIPEMPENKKCEPYEASGHIIVHVKKASHFILLPHKQANASHSHLVLLTKSHAELRCFLSPATKFNGFSFDLHADGNLI